MNCQSFRAQDYVCWCHGDAATTFFINYDCNESKLNSSISGLEILLEQVLSVCFGVMLLFSALVCEHGDEQKEHILCGM